MAEAYAAGGAVRGATAADDALEGQFESIKSLLYDVAGIKLNESKRDLVRSRLARRLRATGGGSLRDYVAFVQTPEGREELVEMIDALTTNKTSFFREDRHFDFLQELLGARDPSVGMTVWSAGCSTGEEPYTLAMLLAENRRERGGPPSRILATDISGQALAKAQRGVYTAAIVQPVPPALRQKYLKRADVAGSYEVGDDLRRLVRFSRLNLMGDWPMRGPFDAIFCRNVMIYFDAPTKERLVERFAGLLAPGGHLFVGHAESLSSLQHGLRYVLPAVYQKR
jgi:chemotaxis protein methyltransferase CheR